MKYAMKPSSRLIDLNSTNKIIFLKDEKQLINFFHQRMKEDLVNPIVKSERYNWRDRSKPNDIAPTDITKVYSLFVGQGVDFPFLSWSSRVMKHIFSVFGGKYRWEYAKIVHRMRSLPCNWILYEIVERDDGSVLRQIGWGNFWRIAEKDKRFENISLTYKVPE